MKRFRLAGLLHAPLVVVLLKLAIFFLILATIVPICLLIVVAYFLSFFNTRQACSLSNLMAACLWTMMLWSFRLSVTMKIKGDGNESVKPVATESLRAGQSKDDDIHVLSDPLGASSLGSGPSSISVTEPLGASSLGSGPSSISATDPLGASSLGQASFSIFTPSVNIPRDSYLVISNHIGSLDYLLVNSLNCHMLADSKYSFKSSLQYLIPVFYFWAKSSNQLVLSRDYEKDKASIKRFVNFLVFNRMPAWIILFCEGSRFSLLKKRQSDEFCRVAGKAPFRNVLCPRYKGFSMLQDCLKGSHIKKVLDLTFYCDGERPSLLNVLFSPRKYSVICDYRIVDLAGKSEDFVFEAFRRKDDLIDLWKMTG